METIETVAFLVLPNVLELVRWLMNLPQLGGLVLVLAVVAIVGFVECVLVHERALLEETPENGWIEV